MEPSSTTRYDPVNRADTPDADEASDAETICRTATPTKNRSSEFLRGKEPGTPNRRHQLRHWRWEALSLLLSAGCVVAMAVLPACYDGATVDEWPLSINLSTVIALLTITMRATMLLAVAEVLGQMKWRFFDRRRPLADIQNFDHASRSIFGSAKLIWIARSSGTSIAAALITILSVAVGPFTQQAVSTVSCSRTVLGAKASLPIAHHFPGTNRFFAIKSGLASDVKGAVLNALVNPAIDDGSIQAACQTGNCTFPALSSGVTHSTIGICSACFDTTSFIYRQVRSSGSIDDHLPNGLGIESSFQSISVKTSLEDLGWAKDAFSPEFAMVSGIALSNSTIFSSNQEPCVNHLESTVCSGSSGAPVAVSCSLYACIKNFHAQVKRGELTERVVSTQPATGKSEKHHKTLGLQLPCLLDGVEYSLHNMSQIPQVKTELIAINGTTVPVPEACVYGLHDGWAGFLSEYLALELLNGSCTSGSCNKWWLEVFGNNGSASLDSVSETFDRFATILTNVIRKTGTKNYASFSNNSRVEDLVIGSVLETTACMKFNRRWVLLPIILVSATAVLLLVAIVQSWKDPNIPVWKTSVLPLVFYGVGSSDGGEAKAVESPMDLDKLRAHAESITARFQTSPGAGFERESEE